MARTEMTKTPAKCHRCENYKMYLVRISPQNQVPGSLWHISGQVCSEVASENGSLEPWKCCFRRWFWKTVDLLIIITSNIHPYHYHCLPWALRREQYVLWQCRRSRCASQTRIEPDIIVKINRIIVIIVVKEAVKKLFLGIFPKPVDPSPP